MKADWDSEWKCFLFWSWSKVRVKVCISTKNEAGKISHRSTPSPKKARSNPIFEGSVTAEYDVSCLFFIQFLRHKPALLTIHRFFFSVFQLININFWSKGRRLVLPSRWFVGSLVKAHVYYWRTYQSNHPGDGKISQNCHLVELCSRKIVAELFFLR